MRTQTTRTIAGRVNTDGSIASGSGFTSQRTATGAYTIRLPGSRLIGASASCAQGQSIVAATSAMVAESFNVVMFIGVTGAQADSAFGFTATVSA